MRCLVRTCRGNRCCSWSWLVPVGRSPSRLLLLLIPPQPGLSLCAVLAQPPWGGGFPQSPQPCVLWLPHGFPGSRSCPGRRSRDLPGKSLPRPGYCPGTGPAGMAPILVQCCSPAAPRTTPGLQCVSGSCAGARHGPRHHPGACANSAFLFSGKIFAAGRRVPVAHRIGTARLGLRRAPSRAPSRAQPTSQFLTDAQLLLSLVRSSLSPFPVVSPPPPSFSVLVVRICFSGSSGAPVPPPSWSRLRWLSECSRSRTRSASFALLCFAARAELSLEPPSLLLLFFFFSFFFIF